MIPRPASHQRGHHAAAQVVGVGQRGGGGVQGGGRGEQVRRVGQQGPGTQGEGGVGCVQRQRLHQVRVGLEHGRLLALLVLAGHLAVARLDAVLLHGEGPVHLVGGGGKSGEEARRGQLVRYLARRAEVLGLFSDEFYLYCGSHHTSAYSVIENILKTG